MILSLAAAFCALSTAADATDDSRACELATAAAERTVDVPDQLLNAISRVETGRTDDTTGIVRAWPWTINAQGKGHYYVSKAEAIAAARAFQADGIRSIDVGCLQINLMYHPDGFSSLEQAFDPTANALYAARFLRDLFNQTGSWPHAAAAYHSQTPELGGDYQRRVLEAWAEPIDRPDHPAHPSHSALAAAAPAISSATTVAAMARPLGGLGRIIRLPGSTGLPGSGSEPFGSLAAYRTHPVAVAFLPTRPSS